MRLRHAPLDALTCQKSRAAAPADDL